MAVRTAAGRGREVRLQLLCAAAELIAELGWNAVSTRILAERANVTPGLVHYHFPSLQALLRDATLGMLSGLLSAAESSFEDARTLDAGIGMLLSSLGACTGSDPKSLVFAEAYLAATRDETLRIELIALLEEFHQKLAGWLAEHGVDAPHPTASVLAAAIDGMMLHRALDPRLNSPAVALTMRKLITRGTAARERTTQRGHR